MQLPEGQKLGYAKNIAFSVFLKLDLIYILRPNSIDFSRFKSLNDFSII